VRQDFVPTRELDLEHSARENSLDSAFDFYGLIFAIVFWFLFETTTCTCCVPSVRAAASATSSWFSCDNVSFVT
jgi:hypothetical protein